MKPDPNEKPHPPATRTYYKLEEARFFLVHLEQHWRHIPHVDFYLSAFVSAARSVAWVMRAEFSDKAGWKTWFESKKPSPAAAILLKRMTDLRNRATKSEPVKTLTQANITISEADMPLDELERLRTERTSFKLEPIDDSNTLFFLKVGDKVLGKARLNRAEHTLPEFDGRDAKDICREYLAELETLAAECHEKFLR